MFIHNFLFRTIPGPTSVGHCRQGSSGPPRTLPHRAVHYRAVCPQPAHASPHVPTRRRSHLLRSERGPSRARPSVGKRWGGQISPTVCNFIIFIFCFLMKVSHAQQQGGRGIRRGDPPQYAPGDRANTPRPVPLPVLPAPKSTPPTTDIPSRSPVKAEHTGVDAPPDAPYWPQLAVRGRGVVVGGSPSRALSLPFIRRSTRVSAHNTTSGPSHGPSIAAVREGRGHGHGRPASASHGA